jgi:hypothetical protein
METGAAFLLGLFAFLSVTVWAAKQKAERELAYRHELYLKMVADPGPGAEAVRALLDAEARRRETKAILATRSGGLIVVAVGIGVGVALYFLEPAKPVFLVGLIPSLVGIVMTIHGTILARRADVGAPPAA